jgi:DnaK suppressor protein
VPKAVPKAPTKPPAKPASAKPATLAKPPVGAASQPAAKPVVKAAAQPVAKPDANVALKPVVAQPAPVAAPAAPTRKSKSRTAVVPPPAPVIPTHSPDAAKASYVSATERLTAPPPAAAVIRKDPKLANNWKTKRPEELSDEEVKSMPDSEYMNDVQLAFFRLKLVKLKQDIHNSAGETTEHLREDTVVVPDPADRATIEEEHALELRTRDRERKLLKKIEQSIARIDAGDYGYCDETGEAIGVARLIARPTASLSLEAQQRRELKQKMFGD